jgi:hypothetical protein
MAVYTDAAGKLISYSVYTELYSSTTRVYSAVGVVGSTVPIVGRKARTLELLAFGEYCRFDTCACASEIK